MSHARRLPGAIAPALLAALGACAPAPEYGVQVRVDPLVPRDNWATVDLFVVRSCAAVTMGEVPPASAVLQHQLLRPGSPTTALGPVPPGTVGLYALGRHQRCFVVASGCQDHTIAPDRGGLLEVTIFGRTISPTACPERELCINGECLADQRCPDGQEVCYGSCVDVSTHTDHCGRCGNGCTAGQRCNAGQCGP